MARLLALITTTTAWHTQQQLRRPTRLYRIKNSASVGAEAVGMTYDDFAALTEANFERLFSKVVA